jgi:hypothetical protein
MALAYYPGFDVARIDADGFAVPLAALTVNVYNVTALASLGTKVSDANGSIAEGAFGALVGDVIEISHATYPLTCHFTLKATQAEAYTAAENDVSTYIAEDLSTTTDSQTARAYLTDLGNPDVRPVYLGNVQVGVNKIPYQTAVSKNIRVTLFSEDDNFQSTGADFLDAETADVVVPASGGRPLFDHFTDATTTGTVEELLYIDQIDALTLYTNGDKVVAEYAGSFAANTNQKDIALYFAGVQIFLSSDYYALDNDALAWELRLFVIRESNTDVRTVVTLLSGDPANKQGGPFVSRADITGLDLTTTDYDIELKATTPTAAADVTAEMAYGEFKPAAPPVPVPLLLDAVSVGAYFAYSFRKLTDAYTGPCCKVRTNPSSGAYTDIPFDSDGWVDEAAIAAVGSPVYVLFYDQSGNARHQAQLSSNPLPPIALGTLNGRPSVNWDNFDYVDLGNLSALTEGEIFRLVKKDADPPVGQGFFWLFGTSGSSSHVPYTSGTIYDDFGSNVRKTTVDPTPALTSWRLYSVYSAASDWASYLDGTQIYSTGTNTVAFNSGAYFTSDGELNTGEDILFSSKLSAPDRTIVFNDIETNYGLTF